MVIEFERVADSVMQSTIVQKMSANQKLVDPMSALRMLLRRDVGIVQRQEWADVPILRCGDARWFSSLARQRIARNRRKQNSTSDQGIYSRGFP